MKLEELKSQITEIVGICKDVPEEFRARCFEMLMGALLESRRAKAPGKPPNEPDKTREEESLKEKEEERPSLYSVPGVVKAFLRKYELPESVLTGVVMVDGEELHFVKEPSHANARKGQHEW